MIYTCPYFIDFLGVYDDVFNLYQYPIIDAPLAWFCYWFIKRSELKEYTFTISKQTYKFIKNDDTLTLIDQFQDQIQQQDFVVSNYRKFCKDLILDTSWTYDPPSFDWDAFESRKSFDIVKIIRDPLNGIINKYLQVNEDNSFDIDLPYCDMSYDINENITLIPIEKHEPWQWVRLANTLINTVPTFTRQWLTYPNIPFAVIIHEIIYKLGYNFGSQKRDIELSITATALHYSIYEHFVLYHLNIIEGFRKTSWKFSEFLAYAQEYWNISGIDNREELYNKIKDTINSAEWVHELEYN